MTRVVYVNGQYTPYAQAGIHAEDRGFQFGDAVYEVMEVKAGQLVDETRHMARLDRSLKELRIAPPMTLAAWSRVLRETVRRNRVHDGLVYLQVSRGARPRDFLFPGPDVRPTVVCVARSASKAKADAQAEKGIAVITQPDIRWGRCDIKTVMLLPASLAKETAKAQGAKEAWFVDDDGFVTEGASSNAWIIDKDGRLITRKTDAHILPGITRQVVLDMIEKEKLELVIRPFTVAEAKAAREAFITSATNHVMPVVSIDGAPVGNGAPGLLAQKLRNGYYLSAEISSH
ncbi:MAG: D-amino-acid transaminase [Hyphomicrobiales bacterium]|nr:MAG: D-amino-acid transaminase [Hyphomicrobiales bacterium]